MTPDETNVLELIKRLRKSVVADVANNEIDLLPRILEVRSDVLDLVGTRDQERTNLGHGDFEYGERMWVVGQKSFSFDCPPKSAHEALLEVQDALREAAMLRDLRNLERDRKRRLR